MARKVNVTQGVQAAGASYTVANGEHLTGDLLLNYLVLDADQAAASNPSIGFANSVATITAAADTVGYAGADVWTDGDQVTFTGTTLPGGLTNEVRYFVRDLNTGAKTFKVAATSGGAAIDITSTGTSVTVTQVTAGANSPYNGWQMIGTQAVNKGIRTVWAFKVAASAAEGNVTYVAGSNDWIGASYVYRDAHETAPFGSLVDGTDFARAEWGDAATGASAPLTSPVDGCLLLYSWGIDGNAHFGRCNLNDLTGLDKYSASNINYVVGYRQQETAGAAPSVTMYNEVATEGGSTWTLAIRNKSGGALQPDIRPDVTELKWYGSWDEEYDGTTVWNAPISLAPVTAGAFVVGSVYTINTVGTTDFTLIGASANTVGVVFTATGVGTGTGTAARAIGGIPVSAVAPTVSAVAPITDKRIWNNAHTTLTSTESTTGAWVGGWHSISATDLTNKILGWMWQRSQSSTTASQGAQGVIIILSDGTNWAAYQFATPALGWATVPDFAFIRPDNATLFDSFGDAAALWSSCTKVGFYTHRIGSSATASAQGLRDLALFGNTALTGGGASFPARFQDYQEALTSWGAWEYARLTASAQIMPKSSVQIGDGTNTTYFDGAAQSLEFPQAWSASKRANWQMSWNALDDSVDLIVKAKSGDTVNLASGVAATDTGQNLIIHAGSSLSATYNFAQSFVGWRSVVDSVGLPWTGATFKECGTVTIAGGGDLTNCTIAKTSSGNAALAITANGTTLDGCTIDGTGAAYAMEFGTAVKEITIASSAITAGSTDKAHALKTAATVAAGAFVTGDHYEIKTVGTTDFTLIGASANTIGVRFTATGAGSGTGDAYEAVKITISGTTSLAESDVTSAGAVVWVAAPELYQSVAITGLANTYRVQIFDIEYDLAVSGVTVTPTAGATYTHNGITWTVRSASIVAGTGTITVYGTGAPAASGTLTKTGGTGDASVSFSAYAVGGTELYIGVPGATSYTWTDTVAAAAPRVIRVRVMEDGPGTSDAIEMIDAIVGMCGITDGTESVGYLVAAVADDVYNDRGVDGSAITGITIDDTTLRLEIASGTITNYNGTDVLVVDGRDLYAYETYWLGTTAGMRDEARFIEAIDAVNFRCSNFKLKGTSGYPIMINNCFIVDAATGIFSSMVDYSGDPISNHPEHMKAIVVTTSDSVVTGTPATVAAAVAAAAAATPFAANVKQVNDLTVSGTGVPPTYDADGVLVDPGDPLVLA